MYAALWREGSCVKSYRYCLNLWSHDKPPGQFCLLLDEAISVWATPAIHNLPWFLFSPGILYFHLIVFSPGIACLVTVIIMLYSISKANQILALSNMVSAVLLPAHHYLCDICTLWDISFYLFKSGQTTWETNSSCAGDQHITLSCMK